MVKKFLAFAVSAVCAFACLTAGCNLLFPENNSGDDNPNVNVNKGGVPHSSAEGIPDRLTSDADKIVNFAKGRTDGFRAADGYSNGGVFNCWWSAGNAVIESLMSMSVTKSGGGYAGAEYRSDLSFSFGYYSVSMKAAKCSGVISSFFTYTNHPWDEIDIEFLGNDTTKIQLNYYTNGTGGHEFLYELGFDGAEGFHEYGFDWQPGYIVWYVDGKAVYKANENIPSTSGKIMMNVWNTRGVDEWAGALDESSLPATAQYAWVAYRAN